MSKSAAVALSLGLAALPASAQTLQSQLSSCVAIGGVLQRLACYDAVAKGAGVAPAVHAPMPATIPPGRTAAAAPPPVQEFGSEKMVHPPATPPGIDHIDAGIAQLSRDAFGKFTVTLSNGQVWRQLNSDSDLVKPRQSMHSVRIEHAVMGSYSLQFNDSSRVYKVARVQ